MMHPNQNCMNNSNISTRLTPTHLYFLSMGKRDVITHKDFGMGLGYIQILVYFTNWVKRFLWLM